MGKFLRAILILGRVSNLPAVWTNILVGWLVGGGLLEGSILWLVLGVSLLYAGGMTLNDAFDREWDGRHAPERPIPSGAISATAVWVLGTLELLAGTAVVLMLTEASPKILAALLVCIVFYNWIHKRWTGSVWIMGACRALVYFLAWSDARSEMRMGGFSMLLATIAGGVVLYIAALTFAARSERRSEKTEKGKSSPLGSLAIFLLIAPASFPMLTQYHSPTMRPPLGLVFCGIIGSLTWIAMIMSKLGGSRTAQGIAWGIAGIALYDACITVLLDWRAGVIALACFAFALILQKFIPAT